MEALVTMEDRERFDDLEAHAARLLHSDKIWVSTFDVVARYFAQQRLSDQSQPECLPALVEKSLQQS